MVLIFGFTGIIGALVKTSPWIMIWYRTLLAAFTIWIYGKITKCFNTGIENYTKLKLLGIGVIIATHWVTFYQAIKISNVSVTLSCFASGSFFASLLEPLIFKRKIQLYEVLLGILVFVGIGFIFSIQTQFVNGIVLSVFSAFLAALFTVLNGTLAPKIEATTLSVYEMAGGFLGLTMYFLLTGQLNPAFLHVQTSDWWLILLLSIVCTAFTFVLGVNIMRHLSPYTVVLAVNLEPVYSIILAHFILKEGKCLGLGFYVGTTIILISVFANVIIKPIKKTV
jgi:drug/metabolite transporter (DMT)-like permease